MNDNVLLFNVTTCHEHRRIFILTLFLVDNVYSIADSHNSVTAGYHVEDIVLISHFPKVMDKE